MPPQKKARPSKYDSPHRLPKNNMKLRPSWTWIPSLFWLESIPYALLNIVVLVLYKRFGFSDTSATLYTALFSLPWALKYCWKILLGNVGYLHKKILLAEFLLAAAFAMLALALWQRVNWYYVSTLFFVIALGGVLHHIAAENLYKYAQSPFGRAKNVGIRNFYSRLSVVCIEGFFLIGIGLLEIFLRHIRLAWTWAFSLLALAFVTLGAYHTLCWWRMLRFSLSKAKKSPSTPWQRLRNISKTFIQQPAFVKQFVFLLFFPLPTAILQKSTALFLLATPHQGGLGIPISDFGFIKGVLGFSVFTVGNIFGNFLIREKGLQQWNLLMHLACLLPALLYLPLAYYQPESPTWLYGVVVAEQLGNGFGMAFYFFAVLYFSKNTFKHLHYHFCFSILYLGQAIWGGIAGIFTMQLGYYRTFIIVSLFAPLVFLYTHSIKFPTLFGKRNP